MQNHLLVVDDVELAAILAALKFLNDDDAFGPLIERLQSEEPYLVVHTHNFGTSTYLEPSHDAASRRIIDLAKEDNDEDDRPDLYSADFAVAYAAAVDCFGNSPHDSYEIFSAAELVG